jgi:oligopeptide transport system substrate-binding protein
VKQRKLMFAGSLVAAGALTLTACGGSSGGNSSSGNDGGGKSGGSITVYNSKPQNPLVPSNTNEQGGSNIIQALFRSLVMYNPETAAPEMAMAESIDSTDKTNWDIKLKAGQTFQDGTPVDAASFVDAWNWAAYAPNGAINNYFFAPIKGYDVLNPADPDGDDGPKKAPKPKTDKLSGLTVVSPTEFKVALSAPQSFFPVEVGYTAFAPLPKAFFTDPAAFGKKPIGNGPFKFVSGDGDTGFTLAKWDGYKGSDKPSINEVTFRTYTSDTAGYADLLAGNLDFMEQVPPSALVKDQYKQDLPDRWANKPLGYIQTTTLPQYDKNYKDPNVGKALSLAIDRVSIAKSVYNNGRTPATGWVSPVVDGYKAGACGEYCTYDPAKAKEFLAKASFKGPFKFEYNSDGPANKEMAEAVCNSVKVALSVECTPKSYTDFGTFRAAITAKKMSGMIRTAWSMDYPSIQNFLEPLYVTGASSNDGHWSNPQFDALIKKANSEESDAANADYQAAEKLLSNDMSVIPLFYTAQQSGWSDKVTNVRLTPLSFLDLTGIKLK